jgi:hypothetical protein
MSEEEHLRNVPISKYIEAHAGGNGWKTFFRSNLFTALVIFILTQSIIVGGSFVAIYYRVSSIIEWKGQISATVARMDEGGTHASHSQILQAEKDLGALDARVKTIEADTKHLDVLEAEHRRLTTDVESLKNGKK